MKQQSFARGFAVLSAAGILIKILSLLYIPFLIAIIGDEGYGIYGAAYQVYVLVYVLTNSGIPVAISKLISELIAVENYKDAVRSFKIARFMLLILGLVMSVLTIILAKTLSNTINFTKAQTAIMWLAPSLLITSVASAYRGYFQGRGNMVPTAVSQIIEQIINAVFTIVFAAIFMKSSLEMACAGGTLGTLLGALCAALFLLIYHKRNDRYSILQNTTVSKIKRYRYGELAKKVVNYSVPITMCVGMQYAGNLIDVWNTKSRLFAAGFTDVKASAVYGFLLKYQQLLNAPIALTVALATALLPAISAAVARNDNTQIGERVNFAFRSCFIIALPSAVGFSVLSAPIFRLLHYGSGAYLMEYGSFILILLAVAQIQTSILQGSGKLYTTTFLMILGIFGKIITNYFLIAIPKINIMGAIIGSMVGFLIPITFNTIIMKKTLKVGFELGILIKPLISSLIMGVVVFILYNGLSLVLFFVISSYIANALILLFSIFAGGFSYFIILALIKGLSKSDLDMMPDKIRRLIPQKLQSLVKEV
ncbi:MAG: polysaccharide biosynthesis protein [Bacillota bacterium]|nr:polysaccharide biosynthesis protein [Bacillota bacterium]